MSSLIFSLYLNITLYNFGDWSLLDENIYELHDEESTIIFQSLLWHLLTVCDFKSQYLYRDLSRYVWTSRKVHELQLNMEKGTQHKWIQ